MSRQSHRRTLQLPRHMRCSTAACVSVCRLATRKKLYRGCSTGAGLSGFLSLSAVR